LGEKKKKKKKKKKRGKNKKHNRTWPHVGHQREEKNVKASSSLGRPRTRPFLIPRTFSSKQRRLLKSDLRESQKGLYAKRKAHVRNHSVHASTSRGPLVHHPKISTIQRGRKPHESRKRTVGWGGCWGGGVGTLPLGKVRKASCPAARAPPRSA